MLGSNYFPASFLPLKLIFFKNLSSFSILLKKVHFKSKVSVDLINLTKLLSFWKKLFFLILI